jgi:hypothetical protein
MLLREVLSDTPQPSSVEAVSKSTVHLKEVPGRGLEQTSILNSVIRWNKFQQIFISYHLSIGECPFNSRSDERLPAVSIHYHRVIHIRLMR